MVATSEEIQKTKEALRQLREREAAAKGGEMQPPIRAFEPQEPFDPARFAARFAELSAYGTPQSSIKLPLEISPEMKAKLKAKRAQLGIPEPRPERNYETDARIETLEDLGLARKANQTNPIWRSQC
jgi:hypothetical protein